MNDDESWEKVRISLEDCDEGKDIIAFIKESGTGSERPGPPKFIDFCRGDAEELSQTSEDENYSVAQFARTMNPAYRASSPAPSAFESHHDPNNPLAREMGLQTNTQPIVQDQISVPQRNPMERSRSNQPAQPRQDSELEPRMKATRQDSQPDSRTMQPLRDSRPDSRMTQSRRGSQADTRMMQTRRDSQPDPYMMQSPRELQPDSRLMHTQRSVQPDARQMQPSRDLQPDSRMMQHQRGVQPDPRLIQAQEQARHQHQQIQVPHNDYPMDGMTQFCRIDAPSDRSAIPSPVRPASRDSQSECSNATSFSSIEPPSGSASPGKPMAQSLFPEPSPIDEMSPQKKRGFFNSPFARRKSKPEIEPPALTPSNRSTWGPSSRKANDENTSPVRPSGREVRGTMLQDVARSASPEPVDPRANFQLNVGNNVFDVASPDKVAQQQEQKTPEEELDPIAQALEELKGVTKQTSLRVSADRYHGLATPQPPGTPSVGAGVPGGAPAPLANANLNAAKRGTPPPSYEQPPMSLLGAPKPAHTSRQMQENDSDVCQPKNQYVQRW